MNENEYPTREEMFEADMRALRLMSDAPQWCPSCEAPVVEELLSEGIVQFYCNCDN